MRAACGLAIGLGRFGLDAQPGRQIGLAQAEGLVEEAAGLARQLCAALGRCQLQPGRFGACLGRVAFTRQPGPLQIQLRLQFDGLGPRGRRARVVTRTRSKRNAHADREGLLPGLAGGTAVTRGGDRQFGVGARLRSRQGRHAFGHRGAVLQRQQLAVRVHVRCRSARLRLGDEIRRAGCERQAGRRHQRAQGLLGHDHGGLRLRHRRLGGSHGAIGLVLVGLCQIAGLEPFADIGCDPLRVVELALCGGGIGTRALPVPPGLTHGGGHPQLGCGGAAFDSTAFGLGQCLAAPAFAGQPQGDREACFVFACAEIAVQAVGLAGHLHRHGLRCPGLRGLLLCPGCVPACRQGREFGLARPCRFEGLAQRQPFGLRSGLGQCTRCGSAQCECEGKGQRGTGGRSPASVRDEISSVHPMLQG
jgi:hypothetical protein